MMKFNLFLASSVLAIGSSVVADEIFGRATTCGVSQAYSALATLSTAAAWCSSYCSVSTKTKTTVVTITNDCTTATKTKTIHTVFTTTIYGKTTTLPTITITEYSSTVLIPSGPAPTVNKRTPASVSAANQSATPAALTACAAQTISSACSSFITSSTTKITVTSTKTKQCTDTTTVTTITDRIATSTIPFLISPPPIIVTSPGVLTTTVPAACASAPYDPNGNGVGNLIIPQDYPHFPQTGVECCVICFQQENCIASAAIFDGANLVECDLLIHVNGTQPGVSKKCPLGKQDYPFGSPDATNGDVYPGPCGY